MSPVDPAASSQTSPLGAVSQARAMSQDYITDTQDRFLTLLVTQLRNQDPLNPMDNAQVTSQIAQLSTVNGITQLNNTLLALSGQMDVSQSMQAANLIGKDVLVPGSKVALGTSTENGASAKVATPFGVDLIGATTETVVTVLDGAGKAVREIKLGAQEPGIYGLQWDGKDDAGNDLPDGAYSIKVAGRDADGNPVAAEPLTSGRVASVAYSSQGLRLDLGLTGTYSLFDVRKIM